MRAVMRMGGVLLVWMFMGGLVWAQEGEKSDKSDKSEKSEKSDDSEKGEKKKSKLTKEEKKALQAKMKLAAYGKKLFQQSNNFSGNNKGCESCHTQGSEKDLAGKVTEETGAAARESITKCLEERMQMKDHEDKKKMWEKNPQNMDALIAYLEMLKPRGHR